METSRQSQIFDINKFFWNIFGIWPGKYSVKYYKYYSFLIITTMTVIYNVFLTLNLFYTPRNLQAMISEVVFSFTEVAVIGKVAMILVMREKILAILDLVDCEVFQGQDLVGKEILAKNNTMYLTLWKVCAIVSNLSFFFLTILPILLHLIWKADIELPICKYYFLSDDLKDKYFWIWFIYQSIGIYCHMTYNVNIDSFVAGLMLVAIGQLKVLNHNFSQLSPKNKLALVDMKNDMATLNKVLQHYNLIITYCSDVQEILSMVMFVQFCMASVIICVAMCGLLMVSSTSVFYGMVSYLSIMTMQIFVPGWLGTQLEFESQELMFAAYNSDWIPQSESFKRSLRLFISRANTPIVITGLKMFPLSLKTFISIMKMAYSFFALLRKLQDRQV